MATNVFFELLKLTVRVLISHVSGSGDRLRNIHLNFQLYSQSKQDRPTRFLRTCCGVQKLRCFPTSALHLQNIQLQALRGVNFAKTTECLQLYCQRRCWCRSENCGLLPKLDTRTDTDLELMSDVLQSASSAVVGAINCDARADKNIELRNANLK